jgi:hypothetical protein
MEVLIKCRRVVGEKPVQPVTPRPESARAALTLRHGPFLALFHQLSQYLNGGVPLGVVLRIVQGQCLGAVTRPQLEHYPLFLEFSA